MKMKIKCTLTEDMLGMCPSSEDIYRDFIAAKAPDAATREEEVEEFGVDAVTEKGTTIFIRNDKGEPCLWDYQLKGFFKDEMGLLRYAGKAGDPSGKYCAKIAAYKKLIDGRLFVHPMDWDPKQIKPSRLIPIDMHGMKMDYCGRPLRAQTAKGERISLANSETVPAGSDLEFILDIKGGADDFYKACIECLNAGCERGFGQWRNSGKGTFIWESVEVLD